MKRYLAALAALVLASLPAAAQFPGPLVPYIDSGLTGGAGGSGMVKDAGNATAGTTKDNLQLVRDLKKDFGATCNGTADDTAAFTAATAWIATAPTNRLVTLPAATCATSTTVTLGDGRQHSTTLASPGSLNDAALTVTSATGISSGDKIVVLLDSGATYSGTVSGSPSGASVPITPVFTAASAAGKVVMTGLNSTYNGGGFVGYGSCTTGAFIDGAPAISTIKYIGPAAPATTLGGTAAAGATSLTVASIANINIGDPLRVTLDSAATFWTSVAETPTGTTVKIVNEVPTQATSGNAVTIYNNPVVKVAGPILGPRVEGVCLDANSLAGIGLQVTHSIGGKFMGPRGVLAKGYTGLGFYIHTLSALLGVNGGSADNNFEPYAEAPQNTNTMGLWLLGHAPPSTSGTGLKVAMSRNKFWGGRLLMGGHDSAATAMRWEFADNNTFTSPYTDVNTSTAGAGIYRQPSVNYANFPHENTTIGGAIRGGVIDGTATGGSVSWDSFYGYNVADSEPIPAGTVNGVTSRGLMFGDILPKNFDSGLKLGSGGTTKLNIQQGQVADSTNHVVINNFSAQCQVDLAASGVNGLDTGSVAANTWYAFFIIQGTAPSCVATATTAAAVPTPTLPAGYTWYAYVGRAKTNTANTNINTATILSRGQYYIDASDTYTPGASGFNPKAVRLLACGGGGGGGSGGVQTSGVAVSGGAGGSGGGCMDVTYPITGLPSDSTGPTAISVTVGAGGAAVNAPVGPNADGTVGNAGNPTFFGSSVTTAFAYGGAGCAGDGGRLNASAASGGGGSGAINTVGITACANGAGGTLGAGMTGGGGAGSATAAGGSTTVAGAASAGGASTTAASFTGGSAQGRFSCAGAGAGGGILAAGPTAVNGLAGGLSQDTGVARGTGGTSAGAPGGSGSVYKVFLPGSSAGGGYGDIDASPGSGAGGTGGQCSGGGGGGSTLNTFAAGGGGKGGDGYAFVWELR